MFPLCCWKAESKSWLDGSVWRAVSCRYQPGSVMPWALQAFLCAVWRFLVTAGVNVALKTVGLVSFVCCIPVWCYYCPQLRSRRTDRTASLATLVVSAYSSKSGAPGLCRSERCFWCSTINVFVQVPCRACLVLWLCASASLCTTVRTPFWAFLLRVC